MRISSQPTGVVAFVGAVMDRISPTGVFPVLHRLTTATARVSPATTPIHYRTGVVFLPQAHATVENHRLRAIDQCG
ncbi:MAG: hypothetical protein QE267_11360 [Akkermansiaceae bacterium]|nr:hypothetical protein [Akkermansiaceae bacterium]